MIQNHEDWDSYNTESKEEAIKRFKQEVNK